MFYFLEANPPICCPLPMVYILIFMDCQFILGSYVFNVLTVSCSFILCRYEAIGVPLLWNESLAIIKTKKELRIDVLNIVKVVVKVQKVLKFEGVRKSFDRN
jgi:hypothetical protein